MHLSPFKKTGGGGGKKTKKVISTLPDRALYDYELVKYAGVLKITYFTLFSRNRLLTRPKRIKSGVVNLNVENSDGTHLVAYRKTDIA